MSEKVMQGLANALDLPRDLVLNVPKATIIGKTAIFIENHKGIVEYSLEKVRINTSLGIMSIRGENLSIKSIVSDEITVDGKVKLVEFEE